MFKLKTFCLSLALASVITFLPRNASAGPGDYTLRLKGGPSFNIQDWVNQVRLGAEFDYDLGYSMGVSLLSLFGVSNKFRFQLIPNFRYDVVYIGPAAIYGVFGAGYAVYQKQNAMDMRFGAGMTLPLGDKFEVNSDANLFVTPLGTSGTPVTFDWLLAFGFRFH